MTGKMKWILLILGLSVAFNLFAAGVWLGKEFKGDRGPRGLPREHVEFNMRRLAAYLPEGGQDQLRSILSEHRKNLRGHFAEMRAREQKIRELLLAEEVDVVALQAALEEHQNKMSELKAPIQSILLDVVAKLDQETRQALAADLFARRERAKGGRPGPEGDRFRRPPPHERPGFGPGGHPPPPPPEDEEFDPPEEDGIR